MLELLIILVSLFFTVILYVFAQLSIQYVLLLALIVVLTGLIIDKRMFLLLIIPLFYVYIDFITLRDIQDDIVIEKEVLLHVRIDGNSGKVKKINNKIINEVVYIKNNEKLKNGCYLLKYKTSEINKKENYTLLNGIIVGKKEKFLNKYRTTVRNILDDLFISEDIKLASFSKAIILGEKSEIDKETKEAYMYTGLMHIVVISGGHISLISIVILFLLTHLAIKYEVKYTILFLFLTFYCILVGFEGGVLRAYIMSVISIMASVLYEKEDKKKSFLIAMIIMIIINPLLLFDIGVQLSCVAVMAILFVYPIGLEIYEYVKEWQNIIMKKNSFRDSLVKMFIFSLCVQILLIPLFISYFEVLPVFSFVISVIGVPLGGMLIQLIFIAICCSIMNIKPLNDLLVNIIQMVYEGFESIILLSSKLPFLQISIKFNNKIIFTFVYYIIIICILIKYCKSRNIVI